MTYTVGQHIDLTDLNDPTRARRSTPRESYEKFLAGTKVAFLTMSSGIILMSIVEASGQIKISFT